MRILTLTTPDVENGKGCRVTIWAAGCMHHCPECQNKHAWDYNQGELLLDKSVMDKIFSEVSKDYIEGITLSGGDPLYQSEDSLDDLLKFIKEFKQKFPQKDIWIYSGFTYEELVIDQKKKEILSLCDVLIDGKFIKHLYDPDLAFRGSANQRIIDLQKTLTSGKAEILDIK